MKPEPLKNKVTEGKMHQFDHAEIILKEDVASAVLWLRESMCESYDNCYLHNREICWYCRRINEAFADVVENE